MSPCKFSISLPDDFSPAECLWFLDRGFYDCRYRIDGNAVFKLLDADGSLILTCIRFYRNRLMVEALSNCVTKSDLMLIEQHIRQWLDLDRDLSPFYNMAAGDKLLNKLARTYRGLRLIGEPDLFETLCWAIIGQQINLNFAYKMKRSLVENFGKQVRFGNHAYYAFPPPRILADVTPAALKRIQFSRQKAEYIINLARQFCEGGMSKKQLLQAPDFNARLEKLIRLHGIGPWTANYALMRSLKETEAFPRQDAGFLNAIKMHLRLEAKPSPEVIQDISKSWKGWEAYAVLYLWRSLSTP